MSERVGGTDLKNAPFSERRLFTENVGHLELQRRDRWLIDFGWLGSSFSFLKRQTLVYSVLCDTQIQKLSVLRVGMVYYC